MTKSADLTAYLFDGSTHLLSHDLARWMEASPRFTAFVETYRDKIRKKIRVTREHENILDLRGELEVARGLLDDRRLDLAYEPYASEKRRGPDFAVTYRVNLAFNVEVARVRPEGSELDPSRGEERILRVMLAKLGQMQAGMPNLLVVHAADGLVRSVDLDGLIQRIRARADRREPSFYALSRYAAPADFYKDFLRLSGILFWGTEGAAWINKQARPGLDAKVVRLVGSLASHPSGRATSARR